MSRADHPIRREDWQSTRARQDEALRRMAQQPWADTTHDGQEPFWSLTRIGSAAIALAITIPLAIPAAFAEPEPEAIPATELARLVGTGCGPDRLTLYAIEESDFPACDVIDTPERLCGSGFNAPACAAYLGEK